MSFRVTEIFYTLQGEGFHAGRAAVFCRFSGCNLWTGREEDREQATCKFCDTNFVQPAESGGTFASASELVSSIMNTFPDIQHAKYTPYVVFTGGEPALQVTPELISLLKEQQVEIGIETNGTLPLPEGLDWITVSPKAGTQLAVTSGHELKLVWPQENVILSDFQALDFEHFYIQPKDGQKRSTSTQLAVKICRENPVWKLSLQTHKYIGIP
ncbi:7-carboxy-7-deazaguanine synthase [Halodesulfovibrio marinisediminis]|uniref:7-carboxy-7-deazaguanine synthase n=1 Tax=Halodesulfovibrio marinisediminis DSM 17456 TaxID=1121457 RepID=A0A1N6I871_9BACT|nr:7-carboxy-7-deazaguanine synthase [Halodesulfovibrio marinisediminis]SIO28228.1 7-carboxy-7-deazaguanine synthase, Cx14CxxC type [Halodesulfovibrio marinisediminis DSM 17456]